MRRFRAGPPPRALPGELNVERLGDERGDDNCFFAFADTVVARSYRGGNECHGWMGVKFQAQPHDEPSQIVMHVRMLGVEAFAQQEALGGSSGSIPAADAREPRHARDGQGQVLRGSSHRGQAGATSIRISRCRTTS